MDLVNTFNTATELGQSDSVQCFTYPVANPRRFGVVYRKDEVVSHIVEKPENFLSNEAIIGAYYFPNKSQYLFKNLKISKRGETEIVDILNLCLDQNKLNVTQIGRGNFWMDVGTPEALLAASNFVEIIQNRQGLKIADLSEIFVNK